MNWNGIRNRFSTFALAACVAAFALEGLSDVKYTHVRNATGKIEYAGATFLVDPMLAEKGRYEGFQGAFNPSVRNPKVELPMTVEELMRGVEAIIVTHTHLDHWDEVAQKVIDKGIPVFAQDEKDAADIRNQGFKDVRVMQPSATFKGVTLTHVEGSHGTLEHYDNPDLAAVLGESMGFLLSAPGEKTVYFMGDTVWTQRVSKTIRNFKPAVLVMNTGYAKTLFYNASIIMGIEDVARATRLAPEAKIVTVHMDAINHCTVSRENMRAFVGKAKLGNRVFVPEDGEALSL